MLSTKLLKVNVSSEPTVPLPRRRVMEQDASPNIEAQLEALLPRLWRFAITLTKEASQAEDLVQDTCVRALDKAHLFKPGTHFDRWCFTIMANLRRSSFRRKPMDALSDEDVDQLESDAPNPETHAYTRQVLSAVDQLPEGQRALVALVYGEGLTYQEAANVLDVPIGTVMSRLHAARGKLAPLGD